MTGWSLASLRNRKLASVTAGVEQGREVGEDEVRSQQADRKPRRGFQAKKGHRSISFYEDHSGY